MQLGYFLRRCLQLPLLKSQIDPLTRSLFLLAIPVIGQALFRTVLFLVDRALLGHFSDEALASMQIAGTFVFTLLTIIGSFTVGAIEITRRAIRSNEKGIAGASVRASLMLSLLIGAVAATFSFFSINAICGLFPKATLGVALAAKGYLHYVLPALPVYLFVMAATCILQASGDTKTPFRIGSLCTCLHIGLDVILIFGFLGLPALGTVGAALASVIATFIQGIWLSFAALKSPKLSPFFNDLGDEFTAIRRILSVSFASFIERGVQYGSYFIFMIMVGALGTAAMATHQALIAIGALCFLAADGFGIAAATAVSQQLGKASPREAERSACIATILGTLLLSAVAFLFLIMPALFMRLFTTDPEIISLGAHCLQVAAILQPLTAISVVMADSLRGAGDTKMAAMISLFGGVFVRFLAAYYFAFVLDLGLVGIWWGIAADWLVRTLLVVPAFLNGRWLYKKV